MSETSEKISRAVMGEFALGLQRMFVIVGIPILLGVGGWLGTRAVSTIDDLGKRMELQGAKTQDKLDALQRSLGDQGLAVTVLQNSVSLRAAQRDDQVRVINERVSDHETRIRLCERGGCPAGGLSGPR